MKYSLVEPPPLLDAATGALTAGTLKALKSTSLRQLSLRFLHYGVSSLKAFGSGAGIRIAPLRVVALCLSGGDSAHIGGLVNEQWRTVSLLFIKLPLATDYDLSCAFSAKLQPVACTASLSPSSRRLRRHRKTDERNKAGCKSGVTLKIIVEVVKSFLASPKQKAGQTFPRAVHWSEGGREGDSRLPGHGTTCAAFRTTAERTLLAFACSANCSKGYGFCRYEHTTGHTHTYALPPTAVFGDDRSPTLAPNNHWLRQSVTAHSTLRPRRPHYTDSQDSTGERRGKALLALFLVILAPQRAVTGPGPPGTRIRPERRSPHTLSLWLDRRSRAFQQP